MSEQPEIAKVKTDKKFSDIKFSAGTMVLTVFCTILIIIATFTQISISYYEQIAGPALGKIIEVLKFLHIDGFFEYPYIPQVPVILFSASLLGGFYGFIAVFLYIILGFFFPIFAMGGGIKYILEYGFGYILAFIPTVVICGHMLKKKSNFLHYLKILLIGVFLINIIGIIYLFIIVILKQDSFSYAFDWLRVQGGIKILYDFIYGLLALYLGRVIRRICSILMS